MKIIRTIHPVGQGAFYSERFVDDSNNTTALVVYDCGSTNKGYLKSEISSYFENTDTIDLLFISHFDKDHVNGIKLLLEKKIKIRTVVIPLIQPDDEWFYIMSIGIKNANAVKNSKDFFRADNIIKVKPIEDSQAHEENKSYYIDDDNNEDTTIESGTAIFLNKLTPWSYITFNFDAENRIEKLKTNLSQQNIDGSKLNEIDYLKNYSTTINKAYKNVCSDGSNKSSLIVYSGLYNEDDYLGDISFCYGCCNMPCNFCFPYNIKIPKEGCLYLGDTDLNQYSSNDKDLLDELLTRLNKQKNRISLIQIPHHGANINFNDKIFSTFNRCHHFFVSYGNANTYGHPSNEVIRQILNNGYNYYGVCECKNSRLIMIIRCHNNQNRNQIKKS